MKNKKNIPPTIINKAWEVTDPTIQRDYYDRQYMWEVVYAESAGKAKLKCTDVDGSYINIKARRCRYHDIIFDKGQEIKRGQLEKSIRDMEIKNKRTEKVLSFPEDEMFYVQNGYVGNSVSWWRLENNGYTCDLDKAQKYTRQQILEQFVNGREEDRIWAASHVEQHIRQHVDSQYLDSNFVA